MKKPNASNPRVNVAIFLLTAVTACAQFSGLSTTSDGGAVYFSSTLSPRGAVPDFSWKIFRIDSAGAHMLADDPSARTNPFTPYVYAPQVSSDGGVVIYRSSTPCGPGGPGCAGLVVTYVLTAGGAAQPYQGAGVISRGGRYLALSSSSAGIQLLDLTTGATVFQSKTVSPSSVAVADDGTTVVAVPSGVSLIRNDQVASLANDAHVTGVAIDAAATTVVWTTQVSSELRAVFLFDVATGAQRQLSPADTDSWNVSMSSDGQWVLYLSRVAGVPQVFLGPTSGAYPAVQLSSVPAGIAEATLAGDAQHAFAVAGDGSLLRFNAAVAKALGETWVGPTPTIPSPPEPVYAQRAARGSLFFLTGAGLNAATLTIGGIDAPVVSSSDTSLTFQVPWEASLSSSDALVFPRGGAPYFTDAYPIAIESFLPRAIPLGPSYTDANGYAIPPIAYHTDWSGLVTAASPAAPGEVLHFFLTGCGLVGGPMVTGAPAPLSPLAWVTTPIYISLDSGTGVNDPNPLYAPFFGLAPTQLGVYQLDLQLPMSPPRGPITIRVDFGYGLSVALLGPIPVNPANPE